MNKSNRKKLVRKQFLKRSEINHPNKSTGSGEAFKKLTKAKKDVNQFINILKNNK